MRNSWRKFSFAKQIFIVVFGLHFFCIFSFCLHHIFTKEKPRVKIAVRTMLAPSVTQFVANAQVVKGSIKEKNKVAIAPKKKIPETKSSVKAKEKVKKQEEHKAASVSSTKVLSAENRDQNTAASVRSLDTAILKEIEENFRILSGDACSIENPSSSKIIVPLMPSVEHVEKIQDVDASYGDILVAYLQNILDLPERGEVKVQLVLNGFGHLISCEIVDSQSKKNGEFLKKQLPELTFPCFNALGKAGEILEFTIAFKNAESRF